VIGGTSGVGLETVKLALQRGHKVTALSRNPDRVTISDNLLTIRKGDILDPQSISLAIEGHDAVIISVGIPPTRDEIILFSKGSKNVLAAMEHAGVGRIILVSGIGAGNSRGHGGFFYDNVLQPLLLKTMYQDKDRAEKIVSESKALWTIVRPGFLNDDQATMNYRVVEDITGITSGGISRSDVAHFMIASLENDNYLNQTVLLSN
jgi:putative NADH-flavin reductase